MDGGKYVNEGSYKCVFSPALRCKGASRQSDKNNSTKNVGLLFSRQKDFEKEVKNEVLLKKLDPKRAFTLPIVGKCDVKAKDFKKSDEIDKCVYHISQHVDTYKQLIMKNGGVELSDIYNKPDTFPIYFEDLLVMLQPLFEGIVKLMKQRMVHCDIKPGNMVYDPKKARIYMIDFGLMMPYDKLKTSDDVHAFAYPFYPPEFAMTHFVGKNISLPGGRLVQAYVEMALKNFAKISNLQQFIEWLTTRWPSYLSLLEEVAIEFAAMSYTDALKRLVPAKVDSYSMAMSIVITLYNLEMQNRVFIHQRPFCEEVLATIVLPMMHPDVRKRMSMEEACKKFKDVRKRLYKTKNHEEWKQTQRTLNIRVKSLPKTRRTAPFSNFSLDYLRPFDLHKDKCMTIEVPRVRQWIRAFHLRGPLNVKKEHLCDRLIAGMAAQVEIERKVKQRQR